MKSRLDDISLRPPQWLWECQLNDHVSSLRASPDGQRVAIGSLSGEAIVVSSHDGSVLTKLREHAMGVLDLAWSPNGSRLATAGQDGSVRVWETAGFTQLNEFSDKGWASRLAWSPDSTRLVAAIGRVATLLDGEGNVVGAFGEAKSTVTDVVWTVDGRRVGVLSYGGIEWYGSGRPKQVPDQTFRWKGSPLRAAMSPTGTFLVHGNQDNSIHVWRMSSGKDYEMTGYPSKIEVLAWTADGNYLASGTVGCTTVWDCSGSGPAGRYPVMCDGHDRRISAVAWRTADNVLVSGSADGTVQWYQPTIGTQKEKLMPLGGCMVGGEVSAMSLCMDDDTLVVALTNGLVGAMSLRNEPSLSSLATPTKKRK